MPLLFFFLIIGIPVIELIVLIEVGSHIGAINTVALSIVTAGIGIFLVRLQGIQVMTRMSAATRTDEAVAAPLIHGFFLLVAGFFLLIPGFITDMVGALLLVPPLRLLIAARVLKRVRKQHGFNQTTIIIEGEYHDVTPEGAPDDKDGPNRLL